MLKSLFRVALLLASASAHCTISPAPPDLQALIPTTTERPSTFTGAPHRPTGNLSYTKSHSLTTSRILRPTHNLPPIPGERTTPVGSPYEAEGSLAGIETMATSTILPVTYNRTLDTPTRTAAPAPTTLLPALRPSINDTQNEVQSAKPIGPIPALWVIVALSVTIFLGWLGWEVWREWEEMMWLERELRRSRLLWKEGGRTEGYSGWTGI